MTTDIIDIGKGWFQFAWPTPSRILILVLVVTMVVLGVRCWAVPISEMVAGAIAGKQISSSGSSILSTILIAFACFVATSGLFLLCGFIAQCSKRIPIRLTRVGRRIGWFALGAWHLGLTGLVLTTTWSQVGLGLPFTIVSALGGLMLLGIGSQLFVLSRRHMAEDADSTMSRDPRPPILFLRSFARDSELAGNRYDKSSRAKSDIGFSPLIFPQFFTGRRHWTFEEVMCTGLEALAPVVAIGKPEEELPALGASRKYVPDDSWKQEVLRLFEASEFTVLLADCSKGLNWEIQTLFDSDKPDKIVLLLPENPQDIWATFIAMYTGLVDKGVLPVNLPDDSLAIIYRDRWQPSICVGEPNIGSYRKIGRLVRQISSRYPV